MTVGIPGAGIGGVFYILSALWMPVLEIGRILRGSSSSASRQVVKRQFSIAVGILLSMWGTAWMLNILVTGHPIFASVSAAAYDSNAAQRLPRLLSYSAMALTGVTLILVLGSVQIMRVLVPLRRLHGPLLAMMLAFPALSFAQSTVNESRAVYLQAQALERIQPAESEALYRRYIGLEPKDAWGYIVLAELLGRNGRYDDALSLYDEASRLAPSERDAIFGRARMLGRSGRTDRAIAELESWTATHPDDAEAWAVLSRQRQRAGRIRSATVALQRAKNLSDDETLDDRLENLRAAWAPAFEPRIGVSRDSDGNTRIRSAIAGDFPLTDAARLGLSIGRTEISDAIDHRANKDFTLSSTVRPRSGIVINAAGGAVHSGRLTPTGLFRLRAFRASNATKLDLRLNRTLLDATPALVKNGIVRNEIQIRPDLAVSRRVRFRGMGGMGWIRGAGEENTRHMTGGGAAITLNPALQISGEFTQSRYRQPSNVGYFAPDSVQTVNVGSYMEFETATVMVALDFGSGAERLRTHGADFGVWRPLFRGYALLSFRIRPRRELGFEVDAYNTQAGSAVRSSSGWKYMSMNGFFRFVLP